MTLDQYLLEWAKDAEIPLDKLDEAARGVPYLHAKWWRFYSDERLRFRKADMEYKTLYNQKYEWYNGTMVDEDRVRLGWEPNHKRILAANVGRYLEADPDLQDKLKVKVYLEETLKFLEDVIKQINGRGFHISNTINYLKFKMGQ